MAVSNDEAIATLNQLIQTCKDGENGFRHAVDSVDSGELKDIFSRFASQRSVFAEELQTEVSRLGGDAQEGGSLAASIHRGWMNVKEALSRHDDATIIAECERGEDAAVETYEEALEADLPMDIKNVVTRQYSEVRSAHDTISSMKHSTEGALEASKDRPTTVDDIATSQADPGGDVAADSDDRNILT